MKIQAVQNQQIQNRPSFSAFKRDAVLKLNPKLNLVEYLLRKPDALSHVTRLSDVDGAKRFLSSWGGDEITLVCKKGSPEKPVGIVVERPDGSTTTMFKTDADVDPAFDSLVHSLDQMPSNVRETNLGEEFVVQEAERA